MFIDILPKDKLWHKVTGVIYDTLLIDKRYGTLFAKNLATGRTRNYTFNREDTFMFKIATKEQIADFYLMLANRRIDGSWDEV